MVTNFKCGTQCNHLHLQPFAFGTWHCFMHLMCSSDRFFLMLILKKTKCSRLFICVLNINAWKNTWGDWKYDFHEVSFVRLAIVVANGVKSQSVIEKFSMYSAISLWKWSKACNNWKLLKFFITIRVVWISLFYPKNCVR